MRKIIRFTAGCILAGLAGVAIQAQSLDQPEGIWFKHPDNTGKRFLYSQCILWPSSLASHVAVYIKEDVDWSQIVKLSMYKRTFTLPPVWDEDHWSWNYEVHPIMGSFSYLSYRNHGGHWAEAVAGTALNSVIYEYLIAGGTQQPSWNDMIATPLLGSLLGEGIYQAKKLMIRDRYLSWWEKILISVTDPFEVLYYGFDYRKIAAASYR